MSSSIDAKCPSSHVTFQGFTPRVLLLTVWTSETSHFRPFLHERRYLFTVPTFPTELLKRTRLGSGFPTQTPTCSSNAMLRGFLPGKLREGLFRHPFTPQWHPGNSYFLSAIFNGSDVCSELTKVEGLGMQLWVTRTVKIHLILPSSLDFWTWFCKRTKEVPFCCGVKGHRQSWDSSLLFPCGGSEGEGKEGSAITAEKVSSWRFCSDPADSPIP